MGTRGTFLVGPAADRLTEDDRGDGLFAPAGYPIGASTRARIADRFAGEKVDQRSIKL
jgi:hypothetical protein